METIRLENVPEPLCLAVVYCNVEYSCGVSGLVRFDRLQDERKMIDRLISTHGKP